MRIRSSPEPVVVREDVDAILGVLFDMRVELREIRKLLEDDGGEEEDTPDDV